MANRKVSGDGSEKTQFAEFTDELDITIGARLRSLREARGFRINGLASTLGVSHVTMQRMEAGLISLRPKRLLDAARILGVEPAWFFIGLMPENFLAKETNAFELLTRESLRVLQKLLHCSDRQKGTLMQVLNDQLLSNEHEELDPGKRAKIRAARLLKEGRT